MEHQGGGKAASRADAEGGNMERNRHSRMNVPAFFINSPPLYGESGFYINLCREVHILFNTINSMVRYILKNHIICDKNAIISMI